MNLADVFASMDPGNGYDSGEYQRLIAERMAYLDSIGRNPDQRGMLKQARAVPVYGGYDDGIRKATPEQERRALARDPGIETGYLRNQDDYNESDAYKLWLLNQLYGGVPNMQYGK